MPARQRYAAVPECIVKHQMAIANKCRNRSSLHHFSFPMANSAKRGWMRCLQHWEATKTSLSLTLAAGAVARTSGSWP